MATVTETSPMVSVPPVLASASPKAGILFDSLSVRRFSVDEYFRMARAGIIREDEHVELIDGVIVKMAAQGGPHVTSVTNSGDAFEEKLGRSVLIREEKPIELVGTALEPDVVLARGSSRDYVEHHPRPTDILLLIEVSESSLAYDLNVKGTLYATAGIIEYWIVDVENDRLEVFRDAVPADEHHLAAYRTHLTFFDTDSVTPINFPNIQIKVADLLP